MIMGFKKCSTWNTMVFLVLAALSFARTASGGSSSTQILLGSGMKNGAATLLFPSASGTWSLTGNNSGDLTLGTANGLSLTGQQLSLGLASGSAPGALSAADWSTFNGKQSALSANSCTGSQFANGISAAGVLSCGSPPNPTLYYQTLQANGTAQVQRSNLNFSTNFSLADSLASDRSTVDLASTISASTSGNAATATALAATPTGCSAGQYATGIAANGNLTCATTPSTPPGGSSGSLQYNNGSGGFAGNTSATEDSSGNLTINELKIPTTSSTAGQILQNGSSIFSTYGTNNFFMGPSVGNFTLTTANATNNIGIGSSVLPALTTGNSNLAVGRNTLPILTTGSDNIVIGSASGLGITTGNSNTIVGWNVLGNASVGAAASNIVAIGYEAMNNNPGNANVAVGANAMNNGGLGGSNVAIGQLSLYSDGNGVGNVGVGWETAGNITSGSYNTFLGYNSGTVSWGSTTQATTTGSYNLYLGYQAAQNSASQLNNSVAIGKNATVTASNVMALGASNGTDNLSVGIGTSAPSATLEVDPASTATSGTVIGAKIAPTYNQVTATTSNTDLLINRTETSIGSGAQNLIDAQVGGTSKFTVDRTGKTTAPSVIATTIGGPATFGVVDTNDTNQIFGLGYAVGRPAILLGGSTLEWFNQGNLTAYFYSTIDSSVGFPSSASVPGFSIGTDTTTGWFKPVAGQWSFTSGGTASGLTLGAQNAASVSPLLLSGSPYVAGTATTNKPEVLLEDSGNASTGWSTSGTYLGVNAKTGFTGNLADLQLNGISKWKVDASGNVTAASFIGPLTGNASTATALAANPTDCGANTFATTIDASGNLTCSSVPDAALATPYLKADGSRALTGNWSAGAFSGTFNSVAVGSAANTISGLSTIVNTGTLTLPTATDTLLGRATTDTLTNKSISGSTNTLTNIPVSALNGGTSASSTTFWRGDGTWATPASGGSPAGTTNQIQINSGSGTFAASTVTADSSGNLTIPAAGAASKSALSLTGSPYAAGTATTNKPQALLEDATTSTGWSTAGTYLGVNAKTGFTGNLLDAQLNGVSKMKVDSSGNLSAAGYKTAVRTAITTDTATANDFTLFLSTATSFTETLPAPSAGNAGQIYVLRDVSTGVVTVSASVSFGNSTLSSFKMATPGDHITLQSDGTNYQVLDFGINTVAAYNSTDGAALTVTGSCNTTNIVKYNHKIEDPLSQYSTTTGKFTAIFPGLYNMKAIGTTGNATWAAGDRVFSCAGYNGAAAPFINVLSRITSGIASVRWVTIPINVEYRLNAGDTLDYRIEPDEASSLDTIDLDSYLVFRRVGN